MNTVDYSDMLKESEVPFRVDGDFLLVGEMPDRDCKVYYISVIYIQLPKLLYNLAPLLYTAGLSFRVIRNQEKAQQLLDGNFGYKHVGKVIVVYLPVEDELLRVEELISLTKSFDGPFISGHVHVGGAVYTLAEGSTDQVVGVPCNQKIGQIFRNKYLVLSSLKMHPKGDVLKVLGFKGWFRLRKWVMKEGRHFMWADDVGQDMRFRLAWQKKVQEDLAGFVHVPGVLELFVEQGSTYLVMEFIDGKTLNQVLNELYQHRTWLHLHKAERLQVLNLMLKVVEAVSVMHTKGYLHRDLNPDNFLLDKKGRLYLIDLEMAYSTVLVYPLPAFGLGTDGYMPSEQWKRELPTVGEDIYGLGALMLLAFTHISPVKLKKTKRRLSDSIVLFTGNFKMAYIICKCLDNDPAERPGIATIQSVVKWLIDMETIAEHRPDGEFSSSAEEGELADQFARVLKGEPLIFKN